MRTLSANFQFYNNSAVKFYFHLFWFILLFLYILSYKRVLMEGVESTAPSTAAVGSPSHTNTLSKPSCPSPQGTDSSMHDLKNKGKLPLNTGMDTNEQPADKALKKPIAQEWISVEKKRKFR